LGRLLANPEDSFLLSYKMNDSINYSVFQCCSGLWPVLGPVSKPAKPLVYRGLGIGICTSLDLPIETGYLESERVIKIDFRFMYGFTNS